MYNTLSMRIGNKRKVNSIGIYEIIQKDIDSIPDIDIFVDSEVNVKITDSCRDVLKLSRDNNKKCQHGECAILISISNQDIKESYIGEADRIIFTGTSFIPIVTNRGMQDLILIHNHPNNSMFSWEDLHLLDSFENLLAIIAVGNTSMTRVLMKDEGFIAGDVYNYIINRANELKNEYIKNNNGCLSDKMFRDIASLDIQNEPAKFGLDLYEYRRKKI